MKFNIRGKGIALNPGHHGTVGAVGKNPNITEEKYANIQATEIKRLCDLVKLPATLLRQNGNNFTALGRQANGYDMFLSLHFNASSKVDLELYSTIVIGLRPRLTSVEFGKTLAKSIAQGMNYKLYNGDGIMRLEKISVLNSANKTNCPIVCMAESEFIDDETSENEFKADVLKEAKIIFDCIVNHYRIT